MAQAETDERVIPMRLEIILDSPRCVVLENFTLKLRMMNPNDYPVTLRGFKMGYIEPEIHVLGPDGEWHRLYYGATDSALTNTPVTIPSQGFLEHHRFLFVGFGWERWPVEPGVFQLRASTHLSRGRIGNGDERFRIDWHCPVVQLVVTSETPRDHMAMRFLRQRLIERAEAVRKGNAGPTHPYYIELYRKLLDRYPDVAYAPEIRWELVKLLPGEILGQWSPLYNDPQMVDLYEECLTFCLDRGGAYAEEFLKWNMDRGGNDAVDVARRFRRHDLLKRLMSELDRKFPQDEEGILYRRGIVAGYTESPAEARKIFHSLVERFPNGARAKNAERIVEQIDRDEWPPKPPDEETLLYESANRAVYRSPEEGRKMLQSLLERFPNGRYTSQIRALIEAIDEGSWPPKLPQASNAEDP